MPEPVRRFVLDGLDPGEWGLAELDYMKQNARYSTCTSASHERDQSPCARACISDRAALGSPVDRDFHAAGKWRLRPIPPGRPAHDARRR
jgi:hypothetical protein